MLKGSLLPIGYRPCRRQGTFREQGARAARFPCMTSAKRQDMLGLV